MDNLEASPFIRSVRLITTELVVDNSAGTGDREVHQFTLDAAFEDPPQELIETVPLFSASLGGGIIP